MNPRRRLYFLPVVLAFAAAASELAPGLNLPLALRDRVAAADLIVLARVDSDAKRPSRELVAAIGKARQSARERGGSVPARVPHRVIRARVDRALKGSPPEGPVWVLYGMDGSQYTLRPVKPGALVVLFARRDGTRWVLVNEPYGACGLSPDGRLTDGSRLSEIEALLAPERAPGRPAGAR
ncbi:MAG: hypothetical protein HYY25_09645 [Candidatus Wallbacteria bacterium]|nr:hypothetical protein [Candidatus Wallbacteria bacterium]